MAKRKSKRRSGKRSGAKKDRAVLWLILACVLLVLSILLVNYVDRNKEEILEKFRGPDKKEIHSSEDIPLLNLPEEKDPACRFDFIDVGQGDSTLIGTESGEYILVDAGTSASAQSLVSFLKDSGVDEIDYFITTHPHIDHIGGASKVLDEFNVRNIIMPAVDGTGKIFDTFFEKVSAEKEQGCRVHRAEPGKQISFGDYTIDILGPLEIDPDDLNNCSVIFTFNAGDFSALFTGDSEEETEKKLVRSKAELDCELYKAGHHGAENASCTALLNEATPDIAVISCGVDNAYGHPAKVVLDDFANRGIDYYITAECGTVSVIYDGEKCSVTTEKAAS